MQPEKVDLQRMGLQARLAHVLLRPLEHLDDTHCGIAPLTGRQLKAVGAHPSFREPVNRALRRSLGLGALDLGDGLLDRLSHVPASRLALLMVAGDAATLRQAALQTAIAVLHRRVLGVVMKSERAALVEVLGEEGFQLATREAPTLHPVLAELDTGEAAGAVAAGEAPADQRRDRLCAFGQRVFQGFVGRCEPSLSRLFSWRLPAGDGEAQAALPMKPLGEVHVGHIVRLLRRKVEPWSATIG